MKTKQTDYKKSAKKQTKINTNTLVIDFGTRKISNQNFSKTIAIPKTALANLGRTSSMRIELVQEKGEKFLKLSPKGAKRS